MQYNEPPRLSSAVTLLSLAAWFGIVTGLVEGFGLLLVQKFGWKWWAPLVHVSEQIIWISALVDLIFFSILTSIVAVVAWLFPRVRPVRTIVFLLTTFAIYDWLTLTGRLYSRSCWLLAIGVAVSLVRWLENHEAAAVRFWKRTLPAVAAIGFLTFVVIQGTRWLVERRALSNLPCAAPGAPNVLVIVIDTLRADHLTSYGYPRPISPNLDRLARQGVLFENTVAASSWTFPSHVALVTGRPQFQHGAGKVQPVLMFGASKTSFGGYPTIGETLQRLGYRTGAFSANRYFFTGNAGFARGFIHFEDYFHSVSDAFARTVLGREILRVYTRRISKGSSVEDLPYGRYFGIRKRAGDINHEVLDWIDRDEQHPFFAFLNYFDVHDPYGLPFSHALRLGENNGSVDEYDDGIKYTDEYIGNLMQALERRGLTDNTLVIITSDHGESLGEHGMFAHGRTLHWSLLHVPLLFFYPKHIPEGIRVSAPVTNAGIPATIMDLLGNEQRVFSGPSLSLLWKRPGTEMKWPDPFSELAQNDHPNKEDNSADQKMPTSRTGALKSLITSHWHLILHKKFGYQLYDWQHDPAEIHDLMQTPGGREIARNLVPRLRNKLIEPAPERNPGPSAVVLKTGRFKTQKKPGQVQSSAPLNDYFQIHAESGSTMRIAVRSEQTEKGALDSVIMIEDASSKPYWTCRNPGDDLLQKPGVADSTPEAFDDLCVNDDINPGADADSQLDIAVPGDIGSTVELYVRVYDWNGSARLNMNYEIVVSGTSPPRKDGQPVARQDSGNRLTRYRTPTS